ncbi:hypothetical protein HC928_07030 [bacterium]|nr:hypothetical protein [bacterium]
MLGAIWLVTAAYCYQIRYLLRQRFPKANRPPKPKEPAKKYTADRSDADLGRLRGELGLTRMGKKPVVMVPLNTPAPKPQPKQRMMVLILLFC